MKHIFNTIPEKWEDLKIVIYPNPILRVKSQTVPPDYPIHDLIDRMKYLLSKTNNGVGLAGVQVGVPLRVFLGAKNEVFINPVIEDLKGANKNYEEGCLSIPKVYGNVKRPQKIKLTYFNENWLSITKTFKGFPAVVIQHEIDHLNGVLFTDHVNIVYLKNRGRLNRYENGETEFNDIEYPHEF
jgi:peptide deformylase